MCRSSGRLCAIPLETVVETMRARPAAPFAHMPSFVTGLALVRGATVPVVDVAALLGGVPAAAAGSPAAIGYFVTLDLSGRPLALAVDAVLGVRALDDALTADVPPLVADLRADFVSSIRRLDAELLVVLGDIRLMGESAWLREAPQTATV
jgi:purine-binding chemotaxis protein CheW